MEVNAFTLGYIAKSRGVHEREAWTEELSVGVWSGGFHGLVLAAYCGPGHRQVDDTSIGQLSHATSR